jgi:hypothetical protein
VKDLAPRRLTAILAALAALATLYAVQARPAAAHDDDGQMTVTVAEPAGPDQVRVEVGLVYTGDGHLAEEAVVSATQQPCHRDRPAIQRRFADARSPAGEFAFR